MSKIHLKNVRLSYPSLFRKAIFQGNETKFEATFLISKEDTLTKQLLDSAIAAAVADAKIKMPKEDKLCLKDGDSCEYDGYADHWSLKASSNKRPTVIDRDRTPLVEEDGKPYAGCYVNAIVDIWVMNNQYGKRVGANLYGVQFLKDGEPFAAGDVDVTEEFDDLDDI
jgi:hypothetical protein